MAIFLPSLSKLSGSSPLWSNNRISLAQSWLFKMSFCFFYSYYPLLFPIMKILPGWLSLRRKDVKVTAFSIVRKQKNTDISGHTALRLHIHSLHFVPSFPNPNSLVAIWKKAHQTNPRLVYILQMEVYVPFTLCTMTCKDTRCMKSEYSSQFRHMHS